MGKVVRHTAAWVRRARVKRVCHCAGRVGRGAAALASSRYAPRRLAASPAAIVPGGPVPLVSNTNHVYNNFSSIFRQYLIYIVIRRFRKLPVTVKSIETLFNTFIKSRSRIDFIWAKQKLCHKSQFLWIKCRFRCCLNIYYINIILSMIF